MVNVKEYYKENKEWLQKIAQSGDPIVRAMALAVLEVGGPSNTKNEAYNFARTHTTSERNHENHDI